MRPHRRRTRSRREIVVRNGKDNNDRVRMRPCAWSGRCARRSRFEAGFDIQPVQELPWHSDGSTTKIYTQVVNRGGHGVVSLFDA